MKLDVSARKPTLTSADPHPQTLLLGGASIATVLALAAARAEVRSIPSERPTDPPPPSCGFERDTVREIPTWQQLEGRLRRPGSLHGWIEPDPFPASEAPTVRP